MPPTSDKHLELFTRAEVMATLASVDKPSEKAPLIPTQVASRPSKKVAAARTRLAKLIIEAVKDSVEAALDLTERAMLPELQAPLARIKASRAKQIAKFNSRQLSLPFEPPE